MRKMRSALTVFGLLLVMGMAEFFLVSFIVPFYPKSYMQVTPTMDILTTPTATLEVAVSEVENNPLGDAVMPTVSAEGCIGGQIEWVYPQPNAEISGLVELEAIINVENLGFYKYEYSQAGSDNWISIAAGTEKIIDAGPLGGAWNTGGEIPGQYLLRIVVLDNENNPMPACVLPIYIVAP
ncbi:MAG: hypothetical protein JEZ06_18570 [Anaerolineaceae bacterium]|nr:hypothetical protein [Anaerolineaceae bacterium]